MKKSIVLMLVAGMSLVGAYIPIRVNKKNAFMATCIGAKPCKACKNCKYCKRCAREAKTCGVCKK